LEPRDLAAGTVLAIFGYQSIWELMKPGIERVLFVRNVSAIGPEPSIRQYLVASSVELRSQTGQILGGQAVVGEQDSLGVVGNQFAGHEKNSS
jgi:hypothetical protein